ncbi:DUF1183-domain-containing protein [Lepidopterella palustris CBS 459.81]|uniref:Store-operated calcium entry-associated regulatory factor n=1 Tax=Lepidopterella palustris CBS 459.81 TaxID=1314670 RepID=A0A8E2EK65_9PEZI|nr:DUF1183-domain-containing protein [Lepidopterella palustris CBS 459.81]
MHFLSFLYPALLASSTLVGSASAARKPANSVLLSNVQTLTLRKDAKTSHRRVSAIPQLKCTGGNARGLYEIEILRCKNAGSDYDDANVQWTCTASLPEDFKLGSTDVICEGYDSPDDPYILKGSCGVEYRLILTEKGEEKYGKKGWWSSPNKEKEKEEYPTAKVEVVAGYLFWIIFIVVLLVIVYSACTGQANVNAAGPNRRRPSWSNGGGGGYGGGDDPPPPYDWRPSPPKPSPSRSDEPWRPGFWSGALGGAAAGYAAGSRTANRTAPSPPATSRGNSGGWWNNGEGSSNRSGSGNSGSPGSGSAARYESTGFGSTIRR